MTDYECPACGGGFPAADADGACPWCGEEMTKDDSGVVTPAAGAVTTVANPEPLGDDSSNPFSRGRAYDLSDFDVPEGPMTTAAERIKDGGNKS